MAKIFLSYARDDVDAAKQLASCISEAGHDVWWDTHLHGGSRFAAEMLEPFFDRVNSSTHIRHIEVDPDLDPVRDIPRFREMFAAAKQPLLMAEPVAHA